MSVTPSVVAPPGWRKTRLDRVASVNARIGWKALTADEYVEDGFVFLATPNIKGREIDFEAVNYISEHRYHESPELKLRPGDVLLAKDGSTLGIANVVSTMPRPATVNGSIAVIRPHDVHGPFLRYVLESAAIQEHIQLVKDGMGVPHLFQWDIKRFPLDLPPLATQRLIADFLDDQVSRIDEAVRLRREQVQALTERQSQYARRVTTLGEGPDAIETGIEWMPYVSRSWFLPKVSHIFRTGSGSTPPSEDRSFYDGEVPWVNTGDVKDSYLAETAKSVTQKALDTFSTLRRYAPGALVVAMYGQGATKGRVALLETSACVNQACCVLTADERAMSEWAFYWFRSHKEHIVQLAMGAGQPNLSQEIIRSLRIPMPPASTRDALLVELEAHESATHETVSEMTAQADLLQERRRSLITAAVTGEFDVTTASGRGV